MEHSALGESQKFLNHGHNGYHSIQLGQTIGFSTIIRSRIQTTVELCSKGPGRKGIPPIREIILGPVGFFPIYFYIGYKGKIGRVP